MKLIGVERGRNARNRGKGKGRELRGFLFPFLPLLYNLIFYKKLHDRILDVFKAFIALKKLEPLLKEILTMAVNIARDKNENSSIIKLVHKLILAFHITLLQMQQLVAYELTFHHKN